MERKNTGTEINQTAAAKNAGGHMATSFTLHIPAGHLAQHIDRDCNSRLIRLAADVIVDGAVPINRGEFRYDIGRDTYHVVAAPLLTDSRVTVLGESA